MTIIAVILVSIPGGTGEYLVGKNLCCYGENLWWHRRIFGGEVDIKLKDAASVRRLLKTRDHCLQQGRLLIVALIDKYLLTRIEEARLTGREFGAAKEEIS